MSGETLQADDVQCPVCGKLAEFVEDNEDMGWCCKECHVVIEIEPYCPFCKRV